MKLKLYGDKHLLTVCKPIDKLTTKHKEQAGKMHALMKEMRGVGLSAPQVGLSSRIVVINTIGLAEGGGHKLTMFNPEVISKSEEVKKEKEGCLSFTSIFYEIERSSEITVKYLDRDGIERVETYLGLTARAIQHEIDHLNGILFNSLAKK